MRILLGVAFVILTSVAAFTYRDLILKAGGKAVRRYDVIAMATAVPPYRHSAPPPKPVDQAASVAVLNTIDSIATAYILTIQNDPVDSRTMTELAFLYMKQGWFQQAIGPLARAREIDATSEPLRRYLELAVARAELGFVDLYQAARDFEERVMMEGHGC